MNSYKHGLIHMKVGELCLFEDGRARIKMDENIYKDGGADIKMMMIVLI